MQIEFTANELHTIAGALYPDLNTVQYADAEEVSQEEIDACQTLILEVGRCIINGTGHLHLEEWQAWDIRDMVPYTALLGDEPTGRTVHRKLWEALLKEQGFGEVHYGNIGDSSYKDASAAKDASANSSANETA